MDPLLLFLITSLLIHPFSFLAQPVSDISHITVAGVVYCDVCSSNTFSTHSSYFLSGVDVHIQCRFKANYPRTTELVSFSVNRTTDKRGVYKLEIPSVEGVDCVEGHATAIEPNCQASLIGVSSSPECSVPGLHTTSNQITVKSKQDSLCIYSLNALSYKQSEINTTTLCITERDIHTTSSLNSTKFFLPYFPPYVFPWPPLPNLPPFPSFPFPQFPPFPSFPFPPFPYFPCPPSLPFPFPPLPPFPPTPSLPLPPPPPKAGFNLGDPRTWIPYIPPPPPPAPPTFNLGDPRTWIPYIPSLPPPPPPAINLGDPRTWIPYIPPPPINHQNQKP